MGRMKARDFHIIKEGLQISRYGYGNGAEVIRGLVSHAEAIELEVNQYREEIERLRLLVDEKARDERRVCETADRLTENVAQLQRELDEAREPKKVVLPKEAVAEIERNHHGIAHNVLDAMHRGKLSVDFLRNNIPYNIVLLALANGYTVEKSKEERLREGVEQLVRAWYLEPATSEEVDDAIDVANRVTDFVTKFNAENA